MEISKTSGEILVCAAFASIVAAFSPSVLKLYSKGNNHCELKKALWKS